MEIHMGAQDINFTSNTIERTPLPMFTIDNNDNTHTEADDDIDHIIDTTTAPSHLRYNTITVLPVPIYYNDTNFKNPNPAVIMSLSPPTTTNNSTDIHFHQDNTSEMTPTINSDRHPVDGPYNNNGTFNCINNECLHKDYGINGKSIRTTGSTINHNSIIRNMVNSTTMDAIHILDENEETNYVIESKKAITRIVCDAPKTNTFINTTTKRYTTSTPPVDSNTFKKATAKKSSYQTKGRNIDGRIDNNRNKNKNSQPRSSSIEVLKVKPEQQH